MSAQPSTQPDEKFAKLSAEHPEVLIAAALVGGAILATILKKIAK